MTLVVSDGDAARLASRLVGGRDVQDTVSIKVEGNGNFNLWNTTRSRRNARQLKIAEEVVVLGASTLSFVYLNKYTRLVVRVGREDFGLLGRDGSVTLEDTELEDCDIFISI
jgi:NAD-specific glutamate dehydrogenase